MCEPISIGAGIMAASTVMGGISAKGQADFQAGVANNNARLAGIKAQQEIQAGRQEAASLARSQLQEEGRARARAAGRGVAVDSGSAAFTIEDIAEAGARDRMTTLINSQRASRAQRQEAQNFAAEREAKQAEGKAALFGSILSAGGQVAGAWNPGGIAGTFVPAQSSNPRAKNFSGNPHR